MKQSLRRGLSALLALVLVLGTLPAGAAVSLDGAETSAAILEEEPTPSVEETDTEEDENTAESEAAEPEPDAGESAGESADSDELTEEVAGSGESTEDGADTGAQTGTSADTGEPTEDDADSRAAADENTDSAELTEEVADTAEVDETADSAGESQEEPEEEAAEDSAEDETESEVEVAAASVTRTAAYHRSYAKKGTTYRILVIGNSYSVDSTQYLYQVATDAGYDVVVGNLQKGSLTLANHWSYAKNDTAAYTYRKNTSGSWKTIRSNSATMAQAVEDEDWDIIIFQQQSIAAGRSSKFYNSSGDNYLTLLGDYVTGLCSNSDVKIGFEMTWAHIEDCPDGECDRFDNDQMTMYNAICDATQAAVTDSGAVDLIIPAGTAIQNARSSYLGDTLNRDNKHLSYGLGRYLAAMSVASACGMNLSGITEINTGSYTYSSLNLEVLRQSVADAETTPYAVTQQSAKTPSLSRPTVTKSTSSGKTTLTWKAVSGATGYQIYRLAQSGGTAALLTTLDAGKSSYSYSYTATGYYYYICALGDDYISDIVDASAKVSSAPSISSLSGTSGGTLSVKWSSVSSITGYQVQIATDSAFTENVQTYKLSGTSKTISDCTNWTKYYVRVRAYRTVGGTTNYSSWSSVKNICCVNAPSISSVSKSSVSKLTIKWSAVSSATGYQVQTATDSSFTKNVQTYTVSGTSKTTSNYTNGKKYYVRVRAYKTVSGTKYYSAWSSKKSTYCLSAPSISRVSNASGRKLTVKWSAVSSVTGYQVQTATDSSFTQNVQTSTVSGTSKTTSSRTNGKKYYVRVRAYKTVSGTTYYSAWSSTKSTYCLSAPSISSLKNVKTRKMQVKWSKNTQATGYQIQYSTSSSFSSYKTVTVTSYKTVSKTISKLTKGKKYYVRVRAYKTVSGTKYYSAWGGKKSVKISK